jgi:hypothetical protein
MDSFPLLLVAFIIVCAWFWIRRSGNKEEAQTEQPAAPYKVEASPVVVTNSDPVDNVPVVAEPAKCGCGRSPSGNCVGLHALSESDWAVHPDNPNKAVEAPKVKQAKPKKPAKPKVAKVSKEPKTEEKPAEPKAKKPRKPRNLKIAK